MSERFYDVSSSADGGDEMPPVSPRNALFANFLPSGTAPIDRVFDRVSWHVGMEIVGGFAPNVGEF